MGAQMVNCNSCVPGNKEMEFEINHDNYGINEQDPIKFQMTYRAKKIFDQKLSYYGNYIKDKKIRQIIEEINPMVNHITIPDNIINTHRENTFLEPAILFHNGEIYQGRWNIYSKRDGFGINISPNGEIYIGLWNNDNIGEYGAFFDNEGNYYKGNLINGKGNGQGEMVIFNKIKYVGDFVDDIPNGKGTLENFLDGSIYEGDMVNGKKQGKGKIQFKDGTVYEGDFKDDQFNGNGCIKYANGRMYEGQFKDSKMDGHGKFTWEDGKVYEGNYFNDKKQGFGKLIWDGDKYYEGNWVSNKQHGDGLYYFKGKTLKGQFRFGKIIMSN